MPNNQPPSDSDVILLIANVKKRLRDSTLTRDAATYLNGVLAAMRWMTGEVGLKPTSVLPPEIPQLAGGKSMEAVDEAQLRGILRLPKVEVDYAAVEKKVLLEVLGASKSKPTIPYALVGKSKTELRNLTLVKKKKKAPVDAIAEGRFNGLSHGQVKVQP